jgi:hypothetical protein
MLSPMTRSTSSHSIWAISKPTCVTSPSTSIRSPPFPRSRTRVSWMSSSTARVSRCDRTPLLCFQRPVIDVHGQGRGRQGG